MFSPELLHLSDEVRVDPTSPMVLAKLLLISAAWLVLRRSGEALCVMLQQPCLHLSLHTTICKSVFIIDQSSILCLARERFGCRNLYHRAYIPQLY